ncbi:MAG: hypothetical protein KatS3mg118_3493 [Paracoccaceae bacterium]|nr:MAG: hypothetical protein KatS3mg118_3493 [Paracoccaceae bacterium]
MDLDRALALLSLPRVIGPHPEDGAPVEAGIGRFGPFVRHGKTYANLADYEEVFTVGMNRAVELLAQKAARGPRRGAAAEPLRALGEHPEGGPVTVMPGRYGPYVKWQDINATIPRDRDPAALTLEEALALIEERRARAPAGSRRRAGGKAGAKPAAGRGGKAARAGSGKGAGQGGDPLIEGK